MNLNDQAEEDIRVEMLNSVKVCNAVIHITLFTQNATNTSSFYIILILLTSSRPSGIAELSSRFLRRH